MKPRASGTGTGARKGTSLRMPPRGSTRIQSSKSDFSSGYKLTVPAGIARLVGPDRLFFVELTEEGILYRFIEGGVPVELPAWLQ